MDDVPGARTAAVTMHDIIADVAHCLQRSHTAGDAGIPSDASGATVVADRRAIVQRNDAVWRVLGAGVPVEAVAPSGAAVGIAFPA